MRGDMCDTYKIEQTGGLKATVPFYLHMLQFQNIIMLSGEALKTYNMLNSAEDKNVE